MTAPTLEDLASVDAAARVLARAARALNALRITLNVFAEGEVAMVALPADTPDWLDVTHLDNGPLPSAALARRLGVSAPAPAVKLTDLERSTLRRIVDRSKPYLGAGGDRDKRRKATGAVTRLAKKGLVTGNYYTAAATPAGRAYLASTSTTERR